MAALLLERNIVELEGTNFNFNNMEELAVRLGHIETQLQQSSVAKMMFEERVQKIRARLERL